MKKIEAILYIVIVCLLFLTGGLSAVDPVKQALENIEDYRFEVEAIETELKPMANQDRVRTFALLALKNHGEAKQLLESIERNYIEAKKLGDTGGMADIEEAVDTVPLSKWLAVEYEKLQRLLEKIRANIMWNR
jgi:hypothetical protein